MNITFELNMWGMNEEEQKEYIISEMERRVKENSRYHYKIAVEMYETFPILKEIWDYNPNEHFIRDRFKKKIYNITIEKDKITISAKEVPPMEVPKDSHIYALYLVGNTNFNPFTKEEFYWIKVGKTTDLKKRMKSYATHNPMLWRADYLKVSSEHLDFSEQICHHILNKYGTRDNNSNEWFEVPREIYLAICAKGFSFFEDDDLYKKSKMLNLF